MGSWQKIRKDAPPQSSASVVEKTDTRPRLACFEVEPPDVTVLGDNDFLTPVIRGLQVYHPHLNWELSGRMPMGASLPTKGTEQTTALVGPVAPCPRCGCCLFWEPIGNPEARCCVECDPPSPRLVENLWVVDSEDRGRLVSNDDRWNRAAFQRFDERRKSSAAKDATANGDF